MMRVFMACVTLCGAVVLASCGGEEAARTAEALSVLRVGVLPEEAPDIVREKYTKLLDLVTADLGIGYELTVADDYQTLVDLFSKHELDLAKFGGYLFALVSEEVGAVPLVQRDLDTRFTSYFIAKGDDTSATLQGFRGKTILFGSRLSTSGHLMPRSYLTDQGIDAETFFGEVRYSGSHDRTVLQVRDGEADLGAVNAQIYDAMLNAGTIRTDEVRVVLETPPYANYVWALHPAVREGDIIRIRDAFLGLSMRKEEHREILDSLGARTYLPAQTADYRKLRELVRTFQAP